MKNTLRNLLSFALISIICLSMAHTSALTAPEADSAFDQCVQTDGVTVRVTAVDGVFPAGAALSVSTLSLSEHPEVDAVLDEARGANPVAASYTFDIKVLAPDGMELQPAEGGEVKVSFTLAEAADAALEVQVYHVSEDGEALSAQALDVETDGDTAIVTADSFSYYTVEFTYGALQYVLEGDNAVTLAEILETLGLRGEVTAVEVSDSALFSAFEEDGQWIVAALQPFDTEEWMDVVLDGVTYRIVVTDARFTIKTGGTTNKDFLQNAPISTIWIDKTKLTAANASFRHTQSVGGWSARYNSENARITVTRGDKWESHVAQGILNMTVTYKNAAVLSDGTREDLLITITGLKIHTKELKPGQTNTNTYQFFSTYRSNDDKGNSPSIYGYALRQNDAGNYYHAGFVYEDLTVSVPNAEDDDTFFYTFYGINIDRRQNDNGKTGFSHIRDAFPEWSGTTNPSNHNFDNPHGGTNVYTALTDPTGNFMFSEAVKPLGSEVIYRPQSANAYQITSEGVFLAKGFPSGDNFSYDSGFASRANAKSGFSAKMWQGVPGNSYGTDMFLLPDGITHTYVSSSGWYGKIELWTDGTEGGINGGSLLYGGRYVNSASIDEKRAYDVPYDKDVTYKMTPEAGYMPYKVYIDGTGYTVKELLENTTHSSRVKIVYDTDGHTIKYLTYTFPGDEAEDENAAKDVKGWDPKSSKGGFAHTIHITWQPLVDIDFEKEWRDDNDLFGLRPGSIDITLSPWEDLGIQNHKSNGFPYHSAVSAYTLKASPDNWKHSYINLPKYQITDPDAGAGTLIVYQFTEMLPSPADTYYRELLPHVIDKTDQTKRPEFLAAGTPFYRLFDERDSAYDADYKAPRSLQYKIINELQQGGLVIEKDSIPDKDGSFAFTVTLTPPTGISVQKLKDRIDAQFSDPSSGVTAQVKGGKVELSLTLQGDTISPVIKLPKGTKYEVTETVPDGWRLLDSDATIGTILEGVFWAYDIGGTLYIKKDSGYVGVDGGALALPTNDPPLLASDPRDPAAIYYFDKIGARVSADNNTAGSSNGKYLYGDTKDVLDEATPGWSVSYAAQSEAVGQYVVHESSNPTKASNTVIGTAVDRALFQNTKAVNLTVTKAVTGNLGNKAKEWSFTLNLEYQAYDWVKASPEVSALKTWAEAHANPGEYTEALLQTATWQTPNGDTYEYDGAERWTGTDVNGTPIDAVSFPPVDASTLLPVMEWALTTKTETKTFALTHGDSKTFENLPLGTKYTVQEVGVAGGKLDGYTVTAVVSGDTTDVTNKVADDGSVSDTALQSDTTVAFTNDLEVSVPTGVFDNATPGLWLIGLALTGFALVLRGRRRRVYE